MKRFVINISRNCFDAKVWPSVRFLFVGYEVLGMSHRLAPQPGTSYFMVDTFKVAITPASWWPTIVSAFSWPDRYGSTEKPSQFLPPKGVLPNGPALGPSKTLTERYKFTISKRRPWGSIQPTSFRLELLPHVIGSIVSQVPIPTGADVESRRVRVDEVRGSDTVACVV